MRRPVVHIVGAGLAGLAAAIKLREAPCTLVVHEAGAQAGGRCRSFFDEATGATIDNGAHMLLSGDRAALAYLDAIGARDQMRAPPRGQIAFADMASNERWTIRPNAGPIPWWLLFESRRPRNTRAADYLGALRLLWAPRQASVGNVLICSGPVYERLWRPFLLAALNTEPRQASAALALAALREALGRGADARQPLFASQGLSHAFIDPALRLLQRSGAQVRFERRLRGIEFSSERIAALEFEHDSIALEGADMAVVATPAHVAAALIPRLSAPQRANGILTAHFSVAPPPGVPMLTVIVNGLAQSLVALPDRLSATVGDAQKLMDAPRERLAADLWREVAALTGLADSLPSWRIVRERRATFAALPDEAASRPPTATRWSNLLLAGDYVSTGLPASIEGAVRSGDMAAQAALARLMAA